jgi:pilus assembly protein CpaC
MFPIHLPCRPREALVAVLAVCGLGQATPAWSASNDSPVPIVLYVGQAHVLNEREVRRMAVGNGKVLQATALDDRQVLVLPESPGQSSLLVWGRTGPERTYVFHVLPADTSRLLAEVQAMLGVASKVAARLVGDKILIEGSEVTEEQAARIAEIARRYPQVVNLVSRVGMERMITMDVKFIEIRRELLEDLGVKWNGSAQGPSFQIIGDLHRSSALTPGGAAQGSGLVIRPRIPPFASSLSLVSSLSSMLNFLVQQGHAAILAEPRLSCRSGGSARFVAGGELPIPMSGALGTASVGFKEYGIKFDVSPQANESGVIAARIGTEISAINFEIAVNQVPGLTKRRAETEVNLRENETLVIAGLLTDEGSRNMDRVAGASELPVLGPLFRSRQFRDRQTELAVFITPRFVSGEPDSTPASSALPPMREPTRLLPATRLPADMSAPESPGMPPAFWGQVPEGQVDAAAAIQPSPAAVTSPAASAPSRTVAEPPAAAHPVANDTPTPDRGVSRRWRIERERLRMVD